MNKEIDEKFNCATYIRDAVEFERARCIKIICNIENEFDPYQRGANAAREALRDACRLIKEGL